MVARAVIVGVVVAGPLVLAACSFTKSDDSPVPAPTTRLVVPTSRVSVVGTLPPITTAPTTAVVAPASPATPGSPGSSPSSSGGPTTPATTERPAPPATPARPATTAAPPATHTGSSLTVQAGAFSTREAADQAVQSLAAKGFGGFSVSGSGPFRVVRGGLSGADADALVRSLAAAGVAAFVRG
jgi:cell division protein FtsN